MPGELNVATFQYILVDRVTQLPRWKTCDDDRCELADDGLVNGGEILIPKSDIDIWLVVIIHLP